MEKNSPETKAIYELLKADFDTAFSKSSAERNHEMVSAIAKLDSKLDQLSGRIDDVKLSIGVDLDELRGKIGVDRVTMPCPTAPSSPREPPVSTKGTSIHSGSGGSEGFRAEGDLRAPAQRYVPPPAQVCM